MSEAASITTTHPRDGHYADRPWDPDITDAEMVLSSPLAHRRFRIVGRGAAGIEIGSDARLGETVASVGDAPTARLLVDLLNVAVDQMSDGGQAPRELTSTEADRADALRFRIQAKTSELAALEKDAYEHAGPQRGAAGSVEQARINTAKDALEQLQRELRALEARQ